MSMKKHFREIAQDITDGYCGGWTCLSDGEIRYCEADVEVTDRIYRTKEEIEYMDEIKTFFEDWCPRNNEVLFILFKDGTHDYYNVHYHIIVGGNAYLYIEDIWGNTMHIPYTDIEDYAVGTKIPGESALAAIPEWFEDRIDKYTEKIKEEQKMEEKWYLYYTTYECRSDSTIIIAKTYDDAKNRAEAADMDSNVTWMREADEWDIKLKASGEYYNGASVLTLSRDTAGYSVFAIDKYADEIAAIKKTKVTTGAIKVTYENGHTREFDDVTEYKEVLSMLEERELYIKNATGRRYYIPLAKVKEYVVDMPNDKRIVMEVPQEDVVDKEKFLSMFNVGSYYKISYTDDLIEGDKNTFCIIRFKEYLYNKEAIFENIYDHHMGLVPLITVDMLNIRNDDYTIVKIPYGGEIRE